MELNIGYAGRSHVTAENWADLNRGIIGSDSYVLPVGTQFEADLVTNNLLKIRDGCGCMQGREVSIPRGQSDEITIENGTQGEKRIDLVVIRYQKDADTGIETAVPVLIKGTPSEISPTVPDRVTGDIRSGDLATDWPLYELHLDGISVTEVVPLFNVLMSINELNRNSKQQTFTASDFGINTSTWQVVSWDCIKIGKMVYLNAELYTSAIIVPNNTYTIGSNAASGLRPQATAFPSATAFKSTYGNAVPCACIVGADGTTRLNLPYADRPYVAIHAVYRTS